MQSRKNFLPVFFVFLSLALFIFLLGKIGFLGFVSNSMSLLLFPLPQVIAAPFRGIATPQKTDIEKLKEENAKLLSDLSQQQGLQGDNAALRDQFQNGTIPGKSLLPAHVVGRPNVLPNVSFPEQLILDGGAKKGVAVGDGVIAENNIVGVVTKVTDYFSEVSLVTSRGSSFSGKESATGAVGVVKGQGNGEMVLDNVLLSDSLVVGDVVVSQGNQDVSGKGYGPGLIVGKITGIDRDPSALFQKARVKTLLSLDKIGMVFIVVR